MPEFIEATAAGGIATITLARPERRNSLTVAMLTELCTALRAYADDPSVRSVLMLGSGSCFSSGFDLRESLDLDLSLKQVDLLVEAQLLLAEMSPVTIAVAHGYALAGGGALIAACDFAIAAQDALFGYPVLKVGIVPTPGMPFLREELSARDFRELVLGGELWDGKRALQAGLVNGVFDTLDAAIEGAREIAQRVLASSPVAVSATKQYANKLARKELRAELTEAVQVFRRVRQGHEAQIGLRAFADKQAPNWNQ